MHEPIRYFKLLSHKFQAITIQALRGFRFLNQMGERHNKPTSTRIRGRISVGVYHQICGVQLE